MSTAGRVSVMLPPGPRSFPAPLGGEERDEIEECDHLQEDQPEGARKLHIAGAREQMQQISVIAESENGIHENNERRCNQGGHGTGIGCLSDGAKGVLCCHLSSSRNRRQTFAMLGAAEPC